MLGTWFPSVKPLLTYELFLKPINFSKTTCHAAPGERQEGGAFINPGVCRTDSIITEKGDDHRHHRRTDGQTRHSPDSRKKNHKKGSVLSWRYLWIKRCVDSRARAQTERGNTCGGATKKREISRTLLSINLHFSVCYPLLRPFFVYWHRYFRPDSYRCRGWWKRDNLQFWRLLWCWY